MGYTNAKGKFQDLEDVTVQEPVTKTATFNGAAVEVGDRGVACLELDVTAASGTTPTLDVAIETSKDGAGSWRSVASFAQKTVVALERKSFSGLDRFVRAVATIGGTTPSFTYKVVGELK